MGQAYKRTVHCEQAHFWHMHDPYTTLAESVIAAPKHPPQPASGTRIRSPSALAKAAALLRHLGRHTATHAAPQAPRALQLAMAQREILEKSIDRRMVVTCVMMNNSGCDSFDLSFISFFKDQSQTSAIHIGG